MTRLEHDARWTDDLDRPAASHARHVDAVSGPRRTGDGCCEGVVPDPDGNRVEVTA